MYRLKAAEAEASDADQKTPLKEVVPFIKADAPSLLPIAVVAVPLSTQMIWSLFGYAVLNVVSQDISSVLQDDQPLYVFAHCTDAITVYGVMSLLPYFEPAIFASVCMLGK